MSNRADRHAFLRERSRCLAAAFSPKTWQPGVCLLDGDPAAAGSTRRKNIRPNCERGAVSLIPPLSTNLTAPVIVKSYLTALLGPREFFVYDGSAPSFTQPFAVPSPPLNCCPAANSNMADSETKPERPHIDDMPGMWPSASANSFRQQYLAPGAHLEGEHSSAGSEAAITQESSITHDPRNEIPYDQNPQSTNNGGHSITDPPAEPTSQATRNAESPISAVPAPAQAAEETSQVSSDETRVATSPALQANASRSGDTETLENRDRSSSPTPSDPATEEPSEDDMEEGGFAPIKTGASKAQRKDQAWRRRPRVE